MMTRAEQRRLAVLQGAADGLSEEEIATRDGIPLPRVYAILQAQEAVPYHLPDKPKDKPKTPRARKREISAPLPMRTTGPGRAPQPGAVRNPRGYNGREPAKCGTPSGYTKHLRAKQTPCDECRESMRAPSAEKRKRAKERRQSTAEQGIVES